MTALAPLFHAPILRARRTGEGLGLAVLTTPCVVSSSGISGESADATRAQVLDEPGVHAGLNRQGQSRALSTPIWRLGVQCEGSVRDLIRLAALALANHAVRPGCVGMEAGAPVLPYRGRTSPFGGGGKKNSGS